jgi:DNA-directed RNA polymerase specialized sigma24 family protein
MAMPPGGFEAFFHRYHASLIQWLTAGGASLADAEDATQAAFTQVWLRWPQVRNRGAYLFRVAGNELGKIRQAANRDTAARCGGSAVPQEIPSDILGRLQEAMVREYLLTLPRQQRAVLAGHYDGYPDTELAAALGMPAATLRSHLRHARAALRGSAAVLEQDPNGRMLRRAWEEMHSGNRAPAGSRPVIRQSWARSALQLAGPEQGPRLPQLGRGELALRRSISPLGQIGPAVCARQADATGLLMVITDADGWVLWRAGEHKDLSRGEDDGHGEGACLAEHAVGTSGVSLALAAGRPVLVCGPEHYSPAQHDLVCAGAPVYHPVDGRLLGALCLSAPWPAAHPDMLTFIDQTARKVQRQITDLRTTRPRDL